MMETKKHSPAGYEPLQSHDDNTEIEDYHKDSRNFVDTKIFIDSFESEKLQKLIADKKEYLSKQKNDFARKKLQEEIMFLENSVLPIVLNETTILFSEANKYLTEKLRQAIDMRCDALLLLVPLNTDVPARYVIGVANPKEMTPYRNIDEFDIAIERINCEIPIDVINLPL